MGVLTPPQMQQAMSLYRLATKGGLAPGRAAEFVAAAYAESGLNPGAVNKQSGAAGDFQLLSPGYRSTAAKLGGVFNPTANAEAILPSYLHYWAAHPDAPPGAGGAAVEASGQPSSFYSAPLSVLRHVLGDSAAQAPQGTPTGLSLGSRAISLGGLSNLRDALMSETQNLAAGKPLDASAELTAFKNETPAGAPSSSARGIGNIALPPSMISHVSQKYLGVPYKWGGNDPATGLDCSSFVQHVFSDLGVSLPRTTTGQLHAGQHVEINQIQPGDVIFTEPGRGPLGGPGHEGLYLGNGVVQQSPHTGTVNETIDLKSFLGGGLVGVRRFAGPAA